MTEEMIPMTFSDLLQILKKSRGKIIRSMVIGGLTTLCAVLIYPPLFVAQASFREKSMTQTETNKNLNLALIFGRQDGSENAAISLMKSRQLIEKVILRLDLQAQVRRKEFSMSWLKNGWNHLKSQRDFFLNSPMTSISEPNLPFIIQEVQYNGLVPQQLLLRFSSPNTYQLFDNNQKLLGEGREGEIFKTPLFSFKLTLKGYPSIKDTYIIRLDPLEKVFEEISANLKIDSDSGDKSLLNLKYTHQNPLIASLVLNTLMQVYVEYLTEEQQWMADTQIEYLHERRREEVAKLKKILEGHAKTISSKTTSMESLALIQQEYAQRFIAIELEKTRLKTALAEGVAHYDQYPNGGDAHTINHLLAEIRSYKQQADLISSVSDDKSIADIQGIDLSTANQLSAGYNQSLNAVEADIVHYEFIIYQMKHNVFEPSSLSAFLTDSVSQKMITKASDLILLSKDQTNRSQKELDRIQGDIEQQKSFLLQHLEQMVTLFKSREQLYKEKLMSIQKIQSELIHQKIIMLEKHLYDYMKRRIHNLEKEQLSIEQRQFAVKEEMEKMPIEWASEQLIELHTEMTSKLIEEIAKLVESKNISTHLNVTQSAPLDRALPPLHPKNSLLLVFSTLGALAGFFGATGVILFKTVQQGIPVTERHLRNLGGYFAGKEEDAKTWPHLVFFLSLQKREMKAALSLLLMLSREKSEKLASLLIEKGNKVLWIQHPRSRTNYQASSSQGYDVVFLETSEQAVCKGALDGWKKDYDWILCSTDCAPDTAEGRLWIQSFDMAIVALAQEPLEDIKEIIQPNVAFVLP